MRTDALQGRMCIAADRCQRSQRVPQRVEHLVAAHHVYRALPSNTDHLARFPAMHQVVHVVKQRNTPTHRRHALQRRAVCPR